MLPTIKDVNPEDIEGFTVLTEDRGRTEALDLEDLTDDELTVVIATALARAEG